MVFLIKLKSKDDIVHHCTALSVHNICCRWIVLGDLVQQWPTYNQVYLSWIKQFSKGTMSCPTNRQVYTYIKYKQCTVHSCIQSVPYQIGLSHTFKTKIRTLYLKNLVFSARNILKWPYTIF